MRGRCTCRRRRRWRRIRRGRCAGSPSAARCGPRSTTAPPTADRASPLAEAAALVAELVARDLRVICFGRTRRTVEVVHRIARETIGHRAPRLRDAIAPYRAGYTAEQRRELERRLTAGELRAVVATNALELGIDIGLLDCAISIGFPGTVASLRQQWGRAGRSGEGLAMLVASA